MLNAGDIAILGFKADNPDEFTFIALADISAGEVVYFTDNGVRADGTFRANEGIIQWSPSSPVAAGTVLTYTAADGDFTVADAGFDLSASGDQIIVYQTDAADLVSEPKFIFAAMSNSTQFQAGSDDSNQSDLPPGLVVGETAVAAGAGAGAESEFDNVYYSGALTSGTKAELLAAIADAANWTGDNNSYVRPSGPFTVGGGDGGGGEAAFTLELLHVADQEANAASVVNAPNLSAIANALKAQDLGDDGEPDNTLFLSSGDAIIPGIFYDASGPAFGSRGIADIQIQNELGIQAIALGNHEFDFGPGAIAGLITGAAPGGFTNPFLDGTALDDQDFTGAAFPYLSSNLDFSTEPNLAPIEVAGGGAPQAATVTSSVVIDVNGEAIGVVGATTPTLAAISSTGALGISPSPFGANPTPAEIDALAAIIQGEVDALLAANPEMNKVVLLAHMQRISIEFGLAERLQNVDIIVAGGSNTRLFDADDRIRAGDSDQGVYPQFITNAGGTTTAVVNTDGSYKYLGRLVIDFDAEGNILADSYDAAVSGAYATDAQGVADLGAEALVDPEVQALADAIEAQIIATESNVFGVSNVFLNGNRSGTGTAGDPDGVRTQETNLGNLTADANLAAAQAEDAAVVLSLKNGGGIRASIGETLVPPGGTEAIRTPNAEITDSKGNVVKPAGGISENDIKTVLAFNNGLSVLTLTTAEIVALLEHGVSALPGVAGAFPQVAGVEFAFDPDHAPGARILEARIVDGAGDTIADLVVGGETVDNAGALFKIVTLGFLAAPRFDASGNFTGGGDGYPFPNTNTDPAVGEVGDPAVIARVDLTSLVEDEATGDATFANDGTEQDALAEYLDDNFATIETAYDEADTGPNQDGRIVNLNFFESPFTLISEIQGSSDFTGIDGIAEVGTDDISPLVGTEVTIQAVVTGDFQGNGGLRGFFVQEEMVDDDGDAFTSEGIFVYEGSSGTTLLDVQIGDLVQVTATVDERFGKTVLQDVTDIVRVSQGNELPAAAEVTFPTTGILRDGDGGLIPDLEAVEGMLVTIQTEMSITEMFNLDRFGELVVSEGGTLTQFTQNNAPSVEGYQQHLEDIAARRITVDDGNRTQNPDPIRIVDGDDGVLTTADEYRMGDTLTGLTGVLDYDFDLFRLQAPTGTYENANPRPESPEDVGGTFKVASLNVLNYFTTIDTGGENSGPDDTLEPRGADSEVELERQATKIVNAIVEIDADVLGLIEIENDDDIAIADLVGRINARLGAEVYDFISTGDVGSDAITNGIIYKVATAQPLGDVAILTEFAGVDFVDPLDSAREGLNRPAVAQTFAEIATGGTVTVAVNHLKSKGSLSGLEADSDQGDGQGNNNASRTAAADLLGDWLNTDPTGQGSENVLILGDLNAYAQEDPLTALAADGFTDVAYDLLGADARSYVFDGQFGTLDYILANAAANAKVTGITEWHINADEADAIDYNLGFERNPDLFDPTTAARNSDHDPVIIGLDLGGGDAPILVVDDGSGRLVGTEASERFVSGAGRYDKMTGGPGDVTDVFVFGDETVNGVRERDLITDFQAEFDVIALEGAATIASVRQAGSQVLVQFEGDADVLYIRGEGLTVDNVTIQDADGFVFV